MVTRTINEEAELWFEDIRIRASKINGVPMGTVGAHGGFILPSTGTMITTVGISVDINAFMGSVATKLSIDPALVYQAICDSLEDAYNTSIIPPAPPVVEPVVEPIV